MLSEEEIKNLNEMKKIVKEKDPQAFIIFNEGLSVTGNFEKRL